MKIDRFASGGTTVGTYAGLRSAFLIYASLQIAFVLYVFLNRLSFPVFHEVMEGTILQHLERAASFRPIYDAPTPDFVPLAYNPLYYYLAAPVSWLLGARLEVLRLVSIAGAVLALWLTYLIVRNKTGSAWWGALAAGLFAAAYRAMDAYLDTAHSDSWMIASVLLGGYLIERRPSEGSAFAGLLALIAAFWFKQHGALFVVFGVLFLTLQLGWRSWRYWLLTALLGPFIYLVLGPRLFGTHFHFFTWQVPSGWSTLTVWLVGRYAKFVLRYYPILALAAAVVWLSDVKRFWRSEFQLTIWHFFLVAAVLSGLLGSMDPGSRDNVYIPLGAILIITGTIALSGLSASFVRQLQARDLQLICLGLCFAPLIYDPRTVLVGSRADTAYKDFVSFLRGLDGPVYSLTIGKLPGSDLIRPTAHWVALEDIVREPVGERRSIAAITPLMTPLFPQEDKAYIIEYRRLQDMNRFLAPIVARYELTADLGDRFSALRDGPCRWGTPCVGYPRYLYKLVPK